MKPQPIERYSQEIKRRLWWSGLANPRVMDEIESHLAESVEAGLAEGLNQEETERRALKRFGSPRQVAAQFEKERITSMQIALFIAATSGGIFFAYIDSLPKFDDMGILAMGILIFSGLIGLIGFRKPWLLAFAVGLWIPLHDILLSRNFGALLALGFTLVGAYSGWGMNKLIRKTRRAA